MSANNGEGYKGGACLVCSGTEFEDVHDGFYYCTSCNTQTTCDGMYTGSFDENGTYVEIHYCKPYTPTAPPPGLACSKCASTKLADGLDGFYHCTDCPTKMLREDPSVTINKKPTCSVYELSAHPLSAHPLSESE